MHIFKKYDETKGILIVTHKEFFFLINYLDKLKDKYYIIIHYGFNVPINNCSFVSFSMLPISRCFNSNCLPFTSRNFLNKVFNNKENINYVNKKLFEILNKYNIKFNEKYFDYLKNDEKKFDFICVNRASTEKKTYDLLKYIINYTKINPNTKSCFIILEQNINDNYYKSVVNLWNNNKVDNILFIDTHVINIKKNYFKGFVAEELSYFYKSSKIYMHCCEEEGESRTIHEALCCGCKVLAKENMKGGGLDYLNINNSLLYNHNNYWIKMKEIYDSYENYEYDLKLFKNLNEEFTIDKFVDILYNKLNYKKYYLFDEFKNKVNINNLAFSLPGHNLLVPWYILGKPTADILTDKQYEEFSKFI
tara:strand:- start:2597 stop:3685 length:1089 start_codon:yes stop_codon:yes gene_type:complete